MEQGTILLNGGIDQVVEPTEAADEYLARLLGEAPDFRTKAGLADALLHPQDRACTVDRAAGWVEPL